MPTIRTANCQIYIYLTLITSTFSYFCSEETSKGCAVRPVSYTHLEVIDKYGADALLLTLVTGNAPGNDMRWTETKVTNSRNFANKLWNASRYIPVSYTHLDVYKRQGQIRTEVAKRMDMIDYDRYEMCFIFDFPMYEEDEETGKTIFTHNPFSMPQGGLEALKTKNPLDILAYQYDCLLYTSTVTA